jgi:hypothetical protein
LGRGLPPHGRLVAGLRGRAAFARRLAAANPRSARLRAPPQRPEAGIVVTLPFSDRAAGGMRALSWHDLARVKTTVCLHAGHGRCLPGVGSEERSLLGACPTSPRNAGRKPGRPRPTRNTAMPPRTPRFLSHAFLNARIRLLRACRPLRPTGKRREFAGKRARTCTHQGMTPEKAHWRGHDLLRRHHRQSSARRGSGTPPGPGTRSIPRRHATCGDGHRAATGRSGVRVARNVLPRGPRTRGVLPGAGPVRPRADDRVEGARVG